MRLVSFNYIDRLPRAGALIGQAVIDLGAAAPLVFEDIEQQRWELLDILRGAPEGMGLDGALEIMAAVLDQLGLADAEEFGEVLAPGRGLSGAIAIGGVEMVLPLDEVRLVAPLPRPNSLRDFFAFEQHVIATHMHRGRDVPYAWYEIPVFYYGNHNAIYGPNADIPLPRTAELDYELEIACVIGRAGRDIAEEDAEAYIAGYTIMNDWSARDLQRAEMSVGMGPAKGKDFATSLGPWLATPAERPTLRCCTTPRAKQRKRSATRGLLG